MKNWQTNKRQGFFFVNTQLLYTEINPILKPLHTKRTFSEYKGMIFTRVHKKLGQDEKGASFPEQILLQVTTALIHSYLITLVILISLLNISLISILITLFHLCIKPLKLLSYCSSEVKCIPGIMKNFNLKLNFLVKS